MVKQPPGMWTNGPFLTESDGVHPNERGNELLAQVVAEALERIYGPQIRRSADPGQGD
jgi:lysophospholipase L1-like esterase